MLRPRSASTWALALCVAISWSSYARAFDFEWIGKIEREAKGLESDDVKKRRAAVTAIGRYDIEITKPYLMRALGDDDRRVRAEAGRILGKHKVAEAEPVVIEWLSLSDAEIKQDAAMILAAYGTPEAVTALIRSLGDPDDNVRERAAKALGDIGTPQVVVPLIGRLEDDKSQVRKTAIEQLAKLGDARAVIPLVGAFNDTSESVRTAAIEAVGKLGQKAPVPVLVRLMSDPTESISSAAVSALGNLHAVTATDTLIRELGRGTEGHSSRVAYALGQLARAAGDGPEKDVDAADRAVRALVRALAKSNLRTAAGEALRNAGPIAVPALVAHLEGRLEGDLTAVVELLRDVGDARATPALVIELERGRVPSSLVLQALETCGDERALRPILSLLSSADDELRLRAVTSLRPLLTDTRAADLLLPLLDDRNPDIRVLAAEYLGLMRARTAVPRLVALAGPGAAMRLRLVAIDALGEIADERAVEPLLAILERGPEDLYRAAANALIYIGAPSSVDRLMTLARDPEARARDHAVRALGGVLRDRPHAAAGELLRRLARRDTREGSLAAIEALGSIGDKAAAPVLLELMAADAHRRRTAAAALGNLGDAAAVPALVQALAERDDRVSSEAAWALGKLEASSTTLDALRAAVKRRGWATAVNASAALARTATRDQAGDLRALLYHGDRFVRLNAATGLGRIFAGSGEGAPENVRKALLQLLRADPSPAVREAVIDALSRIGSDREALVVAEREEDDTRLRAAAKAGLAAPFAPPGRTDWRSFHVVDPSRSDAPVRQEPYFLVAADNLATAHYTDARGIFTEERFPPGHYILAPRSQRNNY